MEDSNEEGFVERLGQEQFTGLHNVTRIEALT
jgi:hypothetical protein